MTKEDVFGLDYRKANNIVCHIFYFIIAIMIGVCFVGNMDLLTIDHEIVNFATALSCGILAVPIVIVKILKINTPWVKYLVISSSVLITTVYFVMMQCKISIMFIFPLIIALMYFNTKIVYVTAALNVMLMTFSYYIAFYFPVFGYDKYDTLLDVLSREALPDVLQIACITVCAAILSKRTSGMLDKFVTYSSSIEKNKNILDKIIEESQCLFSTRYIRELTELIIKFTHNVISAVQEVDEIYGMVAIRDEDGYFYSIREGSQSADKISVEKGQVLAKCNHISINFPEKQADGSKTLFKVTSDGIFMPFYEEKLLIGYVIFEVKVNKDDMMITDIMNILYNYIYYAIRNTRQNKELFNHQQELVCAFSEISESKSKQTGQHIKRVAGYMKILGEEAGYSEEKCMNLSIASMMHDIGKLLIPTEILEKESQLTDEEYQIIKSHVMYGEQLLHNTRGEVMQMAKIIALQHHERWDGNGYIGLKGEQIDFNARMMAVADVFDALVSNRSYKKGWAPVKAYNEIVEGAGMHFDPEVVEMFKKRYDDFLTVMHSNPDNNE